MQVNLNLTILNVIEININEYDEIFYFTGVWEVSYLLCSRCFLLIDIIY